MKGITNKRIKNNTGSVKRMATYILSFVASLMLTSVVGAEASSYKTTAVKNISYLTEPTEDAYRKEMSQLDLYLPEGATNFPTLVYFHGGGMTGGSRSGPTRLAKLGVAVVAVEYRLYPKCRHPEYIEDCAAATAWVFQNIGKYSGDPDKIFIGGYSAGSYLAAMLAMDKQYLQANGIDADKLAGALLQSGHTITHFTVRKQLGYQVQQGVCDENSPMYHIRKTPFPIFLQCGDHDYPSRQEENRLFESMMIRYAKQPRDLIEYREYEGTHGTLGANLDFQKDAERFILKNSGLPYMPRKEKVKERIAYTRSWSGGAFVDLSAIKANTGADEININGKTSALTDSGTYFTKDAAPAEVTIRKTYKVKPIPPVREYLLKDGKEHALDAPGIVRFWTENGRLFFTFKKGAGNIKAPQNGKYYSGDGFEVYVDRTPFQGLGSASTQNDQLDTKQFVFSVLPDVNGKSFSVSRMSSGWADITAASGATVSSRREADDYTMLVSIPLSEISPFNDGKIIGLDVAVNTYETGEWVKKYLSKDHAQSHVQRLHYPLFRIDAFGEL